MAPLDKKSPEAILGRFVDNGSLVQMPDKQSVRLVILNWLAEKFTPGHRYRESEVNEMLSGHAVDCAYLRRSLIDFNLLKRDAGQYWRE